MTKTAFGWHVWCKLEALSVNTPANNISHADNLSYIEHIFEISRRPDLLTRVIEYRTTVLKISEDDEIDTKLTRIPSAKKYKGNTLSGRRGCFMITTKENCSCS